MIAGDRHLLVLGVAVDPDDLHPVEQGPRDRLGDVAGREEQHLGQVQVDLQVVVAERVVLGRIEDLEQRARRIASPIRADLVDLVQHEHRVLGPGLLQAADDPAGQRSDVRSPVSPDLGFVMDAAQGDPDELAAERACHGFAERGLAHARRAHQCEDGPGSAPGHLPEPPLLAELADGQVLDDAVLHVRQAGVVLVEDPARVGDVQVVLGPDAPRDLGHPVQVGADPAVLGRLLGHLLQPAELALGLAQRALGHARFLDLPPVLGDDVSAAFLAELLLDRVHLLPEQVLALGLLHPLADVLTDLVLEAHLAQDLSGPPQDLRQALLDVQGLQDLDLLLEGQVRGVPGRVGHGPRVLDPSEELGDLRDAAGLHDVLQDGPVLASELSRPLGRLRRIGRRVDLDPGGVAGPGDPGADRGAVKAPDDHGLHPRGQAADVLDLADGADAGVPAVDPRDEQQLTARRPGRRDGRAGLLGLDGQGDDHAGKDHPGRQWE